MKQSILTIKIAGDSGDGVQLTGSRLAMIEALFGSEVLTIADFPAEIRAPKGTIFGVSSYQLQIGNENIYTAGDRLDILIAFNPAALKVSIDQLKKTGILVLDSNSFTDYNLKNVGYSSNPLADLNKGILSDYQVIQIPIYNLLSARLIDKGFLKKDILLSKNFFALGIISWLLGRSIEQNIPWIKKTFGKTSHTSHMVNLNLEALNEGYTNAYVRDLVYEPIYQHPICQTDCETSLRFVNGSTALVLGVISATRCADLELFFSSYPITPASDILHSFCKLNQPDVKIFQAEDEIASVCAAIGASYAGNLAVVASSGPGMSLMSEGINLAVMTELPLVVINVQRAGPSTGMPTKSEQADLLQSLYGRHGESSVVVLAAKSPSDCFNVAYLACKIALERTCVVIVLSDARLAHGYEVWKVAHSSELAKIDHKQLTSKTSNFEAKKTHINKHFKKNKDVNKSLKIYDRACKNYSRPWVIPGTKGFEHVIGGLEKTSSGVISYDGDNHDFMVKVRQKKIARVVDLIPKMQILGNKKANNLIISWGSSYGSISQFCYHATDIKFQNKFKINSANATNIKANNLNINKSIKSTKPQSNNKNNQHSSSLAYQFAHIHLLSINPISNNFEDIIKNYAKLIVVENNSGQLVIKLRADYPSYDFISIGKNDTRPWTDHELIEKISKVLSPNE